MYIYITLFIDGSRNKELHDCTGGSLTGNVACYSVGKPEICIPSKDSIR